MRSPAPESPDGAGHAPTLDEHTHPIIGADILLPGAEFFAVWPPKDDPARCTERRRFTYSGRYDGAHVDATDWRGNVRTIPVAEIRRVLRRRGGAR